MNRKITNDEHFLDQWRHTNVIALHLCQIVFTLYAAKCVQRVPTTTTDNGFLITANVFGR